MTTPSLRSPAAYGTTLIRLGLGIMWIAHALLKLIVFTLAGLRCIFKASAHFANGWVHTSPNGALVICRSDCFTLAQNGAKE